MCLFWILVNSSDESKVENVMFGSMIGLSAVSYLLYSYFKMYEKDQQNLMDIAFGGEFLQNIKSILFLSMILSLITPVLGSLTVAYADDTIILDYMSKFLKETFFRTNLAAF
jgi:hypothetical protein